VGLVGPAAFVLDVLGHEAHGGVLAGVEEFRAEQVLVADERWQAAITTRERLIAVDPERADEHRARRRELVDAYEAAAGEEVQR